MSGVKPVTLIKVLLPVLNSSFESYLSATSTPFPPRSKYTEILNTHPLMGPKRPKAVENLKALCYDRPMALLGDVLDPGGARTASVDLPLLDCVRAQASSTSSPGNIDRTSTR